MTDSRPSMPDASAPLPAENVPAAPPQLAPCKKVVKLVLDPDRLPWIRQPREPKVAFAHFAAYRDMGTDRSCRALAEQLKRKTGGMAQLAVRFLWVRRAAAYDDHLDATKRKATEQDVAETAKRHVALARMLQGVGSQALSISSARLVKLKETEKTAMEKDPKYKPPPLAVSPWEATRMIVEGVTVERLVKGEPTENLSVTLTLEEALRRSRIAREKQIGDGGGNGSLLEADFSVKPDAAKGEPENGSPLKHPRILPLPE